VVKEFGAVLKHGPRSLICMRVFGCQTRARGEVERGWELKREVNKGSRYLLRCLTLDRT
jgi:hypothetical protein